MFLDGLSISGYRSFGEDQRIGPLDKINLFVGPNNAGKSNILRFVYQHLHSVQSAWLNNENSGKFDPNLDPHQGDSDSLFGVGFGRRLDCDHYREIISQTRPEERDFLERVLASQILTHDTDCIWMHRTASSLGGRFDEPQAAISDLAGSRILDQSEWQRLARRMGSQNYENQERAMRYVINRINPAPTSLPKAQMIPAIRQIGEPGRDPEGYGGVGLIKRLAELQNPDFINQNAKVAFSRINEFLRTVTDNESARLEITHEQNRILVHMDGKVLPLDSLGTGIHEVVILASAATVLSEHIICMEEPELHLHPLLQRKLIKYLRDHTNNQYFITTHSAHLVESPDSAVFHVWLEDGQTNVSLASSSHQKWNICQDLGYRAADLMQANCIIWVEGPSDRIYLNHWIRATDPSLIEGVHYSIMFYGGRLLNHLSAEDPEVTEFISLPSLNRNVAIVIDSDKTSSHAHLNATKRRVRSEIADKGGLSWITKGREIENYVDHTLMRACVEAVHNGYGSRVKKGQFENVLPGIGRGKSKRTADKLKVAGKVAESPADLTPLGLKKQVDALVKFILQANG